MLPYLEQTQVHNSINFHFGFNEFAENVARTWLTRSR